MAERSTWAALDTAAREAKRTAFAGTRRGWKIARERMLNAATAAWNLTAKQLRRSRSVPARVAQTTHRWNDARKRLDTRRVEWLVEREIGRVAAGSGPVIVGPWLSEVGYEILYWVPFVRWVQSWYGIRSDRMTVVTRGGAAVWYRDIAARSVEIFDLMTPEEYAAQNTARAADSGTLKQHGTSAMDQRIVDEAMRRHGLADAHVLHPSLMYRLFNQFWLGHRPASFLERRTKYRRMAPPGPPPAGLPPRYTAVKFYTAASLPQEPGVRRTLQSLVLSLARRGDVVMLDTGLTLDDHDDYTFEAGARIHSVRQLLRPEDNLAVQSAIIGGAEAFVGTCGSLAWLAPLMGVDTTAVLADARFLHGHLNVARRVYQVTGAARFSPLDISALDRLGLRLETQGQP